MTLADILCLAVLNIGLPNAQVACDNMEVLVDEAAATGIRPELVVSMIYYESRWTPTAVSYAGACGLMQVIPKFTGNKKVGNKKLTCEQLKKPEANIRSGTKVLSYWLHKYKRTRGNEKTAVCSYFAGYRCAGKNPSRAGLRYSRKIRRLANKLKKQIDHIKQCEFEIAVDDLDPGCDC